MMIEKLVPVDQGGTYLRKSQMSQRREDEKWLSTKHQNAGLIYMILGMD